MRSPVEFPMYGKFNKRQLSKANLPAFWDMILNRSDFNVSTSEKVEDVKKGEDGELATHWEACFAESREFVRSARKGLLLDSCRPQDGAARAFRFVFAGGAGVLSGAGVSLDFV